jgi:hypothetical protein
MPRVSNASLWVNNRSGCLKIPGHMFGPNLPKSSRYFGLLSRRPKEHLQWPIGLHVQSLPNVP